MMQNWLHCIEYISLVEMYPQSNRIPGIYGSGCTIVVTLHISDFVNKITPISKLINGLDTTAKLMGKEIIS